MITLPLYHQYPGQSAPQSAHIEVNWETGEISAEYNPEIGNARPSRVYHGRATRFQCPNTLTEVDVDTLIATIRPLADTLLPHYETTWEGSNHIGRHDHPNAERILDQIESLCANAASSVEYIYTPDEYLDVLSDDTLREDLASHNGDVDALANQYATDAETDRIAIVDGPSRATRTLAKYIANRLRLTQEDAS